MERLLFCLSILLFSPITFSAENAHDLDFEILVSSKSEGWSDFQQPSYKISFDTATSNNWMVSGPLRVIVMMLNTGACLTAFPQISVAKK